MTQKVKKKKQTRSFKREIIERDNVKQCNLHSITQLLLGNGARSLLPGEKGVCGFQSSERGSPLLLMKPAG